MLAWRRDSEMSSQHRIMISGNAVERRSQTAIGTSRSTGTANCQWCRPRQSPGLPPAGYHLPVGVPPTGSTEARCGQFLFSRPVSFYKAEWRPTRNDQASKPTKAALALVVRVRAFGEPAALLLLSVFHGGNVQKPPPWFICCST
jgi:hypothetical protein